MAKKKETDAKALYEEACKLLSALKLAEAFAVMKQAAEMGHPTAKRFRYNVQNGYWCSQG